MKLKPKETKIPFDDEERYAMFVERKCDGARVHKNKKKYSRRDNKKKSKWDGW